MQLTIITNRANQLADQQINNLLAGQRIVGCTDNTLHLAGGRTLTITNSSRGIVNRDETMRAFEQNIHSARFHTEESKYGHYVITTLVVTVTDENGDTQEHDICTFDHYGNATAVNVDETQNGNQKQKECSNMNRNEPLYELSAWDWSGAHERFFDQHFVGKRLSNDPYAKSHHITFTDGTAAALTDSGRNRVYHVNKTAYEGAGIIERAWIDHEDAPGTYTQRLYVQCENEDEPRLLAEATFDYEPYGEWTGFYLIAFDEDEW